MILEATVPTANRPGITVPASALTVDKVGIGSGEASLRVEYQFRSKAFDKADNRYTLQSTGMVNALLKYDIADWSI